MVVYFVEELGGKFCIGIVQWVAECNGFFVYIYDIGVEIGFLNDGQGLGGKGFVEFDQVNIVEFQFGVFQCFRDSGVGANVYV